MTDGPANALIDGPHAQIVIIRATRHPSPRLVQQPHFLLELRIAAIGIGHAHDRDAAGHVVREINPLAHLPPDHGKQNGPSGQGVPREGLQGRVEIPCPFGFPVHGLLPLQSIQQPGAPPPLQEEGLVGIAGEEDHHALGHHVDQVRQHPSQFVADRVGLLGPVAEIKRGRGGSGGEAEGGGVGGGYDVSAGEDGGVGGVEAVRGGAGEGAVGVGGLAEGVGEEFGAYVGEGLDGKKHEVIGAKRVEEENRTEPNRPGEFLRRGLPRGLPGGRR